MQITEQVEQLLKDRHKKLPAVRNARVKLQGLDESLTALYRALETLGSHPHSPGELRAAIARANITPYQEEVRQALDEVARVEARFSRETVNFGVSGQARVGKSTLLQTLSGLDDRAIPTGTGTPVTAVRSRIVCATERRALLRMHSWESYRDEVLEPYHVDLGLGQVPSTKAQFQSHPYPAPSEGGDNSRNVMLVRLRAMRDSLASYEQYLSGAEHTLTNFSELRGWVAYPEDDEPSRIDNRFLAVREALIECPFPHQAARSIGLVDLPGLGEIAASAEAHHVKGLRDDVDFVLLVKRANEGMAFWTNQDGQARRLIDRARDPISMTSDFLGIVSNEGGIPHERLEKMIRSVQAHANAGLERSPIQLFRCEGLDPLNVGEKLLEPALAQLAESLPRMDAELLVHAQTRASEVTDKVGRWLQALEAAVTRSLPDAPGTAETVHLLATKLRQTIALDLTNVCQRHLVAVRAEAEDARLITSIREAHAQIKSWADDALGLGESAWMEEALGRIAVDRTIHNFATDERNRIRVYIGEAYCGLDDHFRIQTNAIFDEIGNVFAERCGLLPGGRTGRLALEWIGAQLAAGEESCTDLAVAVTTLLNLHVSYRSHFHPIVRSSLDVLDKDPHHQESHLHKENVPMHLSMEAEAAFMLKYLQNLAVKASSSVRNALISEAPLMDKILHAAAEQFQDSFIRSRTSMRDFARFARSWKDELFPGQFDYAGPTRIDVTDVKQAFAAARKSNDQLRTQTLS